jgi:hypothetical protein
MALGNIMIQDMGEILLCNFGRYWTILLPMSIAGVGILFSLLECVQNYK